MVVDGINESAELRFRVSSSQSGVSATRLVNELANQLPELEKILREEHGDVSVVADREKSVPIDPVTAYLVLKFVGAAIASGALAKLGEDVYKFLKDRIVNGSVRKAEDPPRGSN